LRAKRSNANGAALNSWDLSSLKLTPRLPEILSSSSDARAIALELEAGEGLAEHEVHERAWLFVVSGEVEVAAGGRGLRAKTGTLIEFPPRERHGLTARSAARLLLLLTPWPGEGHPGALSLREKLYARRHAAAQRAEPPPGRAGA
jgi:quercetin dioxygenase-like cupin family protein